MADVFQYVAEANQSGIIKLHAIKQAWEQGMPTAPQMSKSGGQTAGTIAAYADKYSLIHKEVDLLFEKTIEFLEKVDENFILADTSQASALVAEATSAVAIQSDELEVQDTGTFVEKFKEYFGEEFDWSELLSGTGYIGTILGFAKDLTGIDSWKDLVKSGVSIYQFLEGAAQTFKNYKQIGNAVGTGTAMTWWVKNITGLKKMGYCSQASSFTQRWWNNLTNTTSPFRAQYQNVINNFKGANGVGKAITSWAGVITTGVLNYTSNKEEQEKSNGEMSDARVIAETVTETAVDTVITYGSGIIVGAAIGAISSAAAVPVVVAAATSLAVWGINAGVKAMTGKTTTELVSDGILDAAESVVDGVSKTVTSIKTAAKMVSNTVTNWFGKLTFA